MPVITLIMVVQTGFQVGHKISNTTLKLAVYLILHSDSHACFLWTNEVSLCKYSSCLLGYFYQ